LAPNVNVELQSSDLPVLFEVIEYRADWVRRRRLTPAVSVELGQLAFQAPHGHDYWFDEPAVVATSEGEREVMVEFEGGVDIAAGVRISPRITLYLGGRDDLAAIHFSSVDIQ